MISAFRLVFVRNRRWICPVTGQIILFLDISYQAHYLSLQDIKIQILSEELIMSGVAIFLVFFISALINGYQRNPAQETDKYREQAVSLDKSHDNSNVK